MGASAARNCNPSCWFAAGRPPAGLQQLRTCSLWRRLDFNAVDLQPFAFRGKAKSHDDVEKIDHFIRGRDTRRLWAIRDRNPVLTHRIREVQRKYVYRLCIGGWEV